MEVEIISKDDGSNVQDVPEITGDVSKYGKSSYTLPYLKFRGEGIERYKLSVIRQMVKPMAGVKQDIAIYAETQEGVFKIGEVAGVQVESFINLVGLNRVTGCIEEGKILSGNGLYVLSE